MRRKSWSPLFNLREVRRQSEQIEVDPPKQNEGLGISIRLKTSGFQLGEDKRINGTLGPVCLLNFWEVGRLNRLEGPVIRVSGEYGEDGQQPNRPWPSPRPTWT